MAGKTVNGSESGTRSGAQALTLLVRPPLNFLLLRAIAEEPKSQVALRRETGSPAQTTIRAQLRKLIDAGAVHKSLRNRFPGTHAYELTDAGKELLVVAEVLERWLAEAPEGPLTLSDGAAKAAVCALAEAWSTALLRALAAGPLTLTDLSGVIGALSYPALQRRIGAMRLAGQIEVRRGNGRGSVNRLTAWLRHGVAPIAAACRWERRHLADRTAPIAAIDTEAFLLLAAPLLRLPADVSGSCRLAAALPGERRRNLAGTMLRVEAGRIASCTTRLQGAPESWVLGSSGAWLDALIDDDRDRLEIGGDGRLGHAVLDGLHGSLFGTAARRQAI